MHKAYGARPRGASRVHVLSAIAFLASACGSSSDQSTNPIQGGEAGSGGTAGTPGGSSMSGGAPASAAIGGTNGSNVTGGSSGMSGGTTSAAGAGGATQPSTGGSGGLAGGGGQSASGGVMNGGGTSGASGAAGVAGASGAAGAGGADSTGSMDITSVCKGGMIGKDSTAMRPPGLTVSREYAAVKYVAAQSIQITSFKMTMQVPKPPMTQQTLFIWPGLQCLGANDPARIGNGILQPVLTWGGSCAPKQPTNTYGSWWISAMYVNVSSSAAGPTGCLGGGYLVPEVGDQLFIDMSVNGTQWTQTITDTRTMMSVDLTTDLKGQVQNWATWAIEVPTGETIKPVDDVVFTQSVLTFSAPVKSCQPSQAGSADTFSAPVLSTDGLHCCFDTVVLKANRTTM